MSKTNHHFVPQFYLRNFSAGKEAICLINIATLRAVPVASIKHQCYRRKFYGDTNELEDALAQVEGMAASTIKQIIDGESVPRRSRTHAELLYFVALQILRTRASAEKVARVLSLPMTYLARQYADRVGEDSNDLLAVVQSGGAFPLSMVDDYVSALSDLDIRVIRVPCRARLITSDNPVVLYNQWCEGIHGFGVTGAICGGLQIFFPLAPSCALMFFDEKVYDVDGQTTGEIVVNQIRDVYQLNRLQSVFAQDNLFFSDWRDKDRILIALPKVATLREEHQQKMHVASSVKKAPSSELLHMYTEMPDVHLKLKFSSLRRRASQVPLWNRFQICRDILPPQIPLDLPERVQERLTNEQFTLRTVETWQKDWGNIVP